MSWLFFACGMTGPAMPNAPPICTWWHTWFTLCKQRLRCPLLRHTQSCCPWRNNSTRSAGACCPVCTACALRSMPTRMRVSRSHCAWAHMTPGPNLPVCCVRIPTGHAKPLRTQLRCMNAPSPSLVRASRVQALHGHWPSVVGTSRCSMPVRNLQQGPRACPWAWWHRTRHTTTAASHASHVRVYGTCCKPCKRC